MRLPAEILLQSRLSKRVELNGPLEPVMEKLQDLDFCNMVKHVEVIAICLRSIIPKWFLKGVPQDSTKFAEWANGRLAYDAARGFFNALRAFISPSAAKVKESCLDGAKDKT